MIQNTKREEYHRRKREIKLPQKKNQYENPIKRHQTNTHNQLFKKKKKYMIKIMKRWLPLKLN